MKVELTCDIMEDGRIKQSPRRKATFKDQLHRDLDTGQMKTVRISERVGSPPVLWAAGTIIEMSDATAQKFIDRGWAKPCN